MATNNTPYLEVVQLYKHYGEGEAKVTVLRDISTHIEKGQIYVLLGLSVPIFLIFIYLLTKTVIDRSARAISYMKVFGYRDGETNKLYIRSITWTVVVSLGVPAADHRCVGLGIQGHADELQRQHRDLRAARRHGGMCASWAGNVRCGGVPAHPPHQARAASPGTEGAGVAGAV